MANSQSGFVGLARVAALGLWLAVTAAALVVAPAVAEDKKQTVSAEVAKKLKPAQDALQKGELDAGIALAKESLEIAKTPYDKLQTLYMLRFGYGKKQDYAAYAETLEQLNALDNLPPDEKKQSYKPLAQIYAQQRNYEKAATYATQWAENGGGYDGYSLLSQIYLIQKDCKNGVAALEKAVNGREPSEQELKQMNYCYYQLNDKPKRLDVMEALVAKFMKREYLSDLMLIYVEQNADERAMLNLYRLSFDKEFMTRESEFVDYADMALKVGSPTEALRILNRGIEKAAVKLIAPTDRNSRMLAEAKQQAAEDKKLIAQLDKEATNGKSGEADVKVGLAYLGMGEYQKAVTAIQRGLAPERVAKVKRVDDANMMLGIAFFKLGNKEEAAKAFSAAKTDARMTKAATVWLGSI